MRKSGGRESARPDRKERRISGGRIVDDTQLVVGKE
jgi:hypothetical protein